MSQRRTAPIHTRCCTFGAGWPSQPRCTWKLTRRGGHVLRGGKSLRSRPTVSTQTRIPDGESRVKLSKRTNGCTAAASALVTAPARPHAPAGLRATTHPGSGRNDAGRGAEEAAFPDAAEVARTATDSANRTRLRRV